MAMAFGSLMLKMNSAGIGTAAKKMGVLQTRMGNFTKKMGPAFKKMSKTISKFGMAATGAFFALAAASPLLQARLEILNLRVQSLLRVFGDELAPIIEEVTGLVVKATDIWNGLPGPMQESIKFGVMVAAVVGTIAIAFMILTAAMSWVVVGILAIVVAAALLHYIWTNNLFGIQDITKKVFDFIGKLIDGVITYFKNIEKALAKVGVTWELIFGIIEIYVGLWVAAIGLSIQFLLDIFQGIVDFVSAVFKGDIEGALKAVKGIFKTQFDFIVGIVNLPVEAIGKMITLITGMHGKISKAGAELIAAFIKGILDAIDAGIKLIQKGLDEIAKLWGGSLPEKGPLVNVPEMGQELGAAYITGIVAGMAGAGASTTFNRTFNIENVALEVPGIQQTEGRRFMDKIDSGIRRATF